MTTERQFEWYERTLANLEQRHDQLVRDFHSHAQQAVHTGFVDILQDIRNDLQVLQARWIQVGGALIGILVGILLALLGVLWTLLHPATAPAARAEALRPTCAQFVSQQAAQAFYREKPLVGVVLDRNRDGVACQARAGPYDRAPVTR